jgi:hypothetical protein
MLNKKLHSISSRTFKTLHNKHIKFITTSDIIKDNPELSSKLKYDPIKEPEKFEKEFGLHHWLYKYTEGIKLWFMAPFDFKIWNTDKDTELNRYSWNVNAYPNSLSNILMRNKFLQTSYVANYFMRLFDHRSAMEVNKAEEPPKINSNSVFLYKDTTNTVINRRSVERFTVFMMLTMAWNVPSLIMYGFLACYFQLLQKNYFTSVRMVLRMDLLPETEQLHVVKCGAFGLPYSVLINIKDLVKIDKEEDLLCINIIFYKFFN